MSSPIQAVVLGAGGYVGGELLRLLAAHTNFELAAAVSDSRADQAIADTFPHLSQVLAGTSFVARDNWLNVIEKGSDVALFSAAPHAASAAIIKAALHAAKDKNLNMHVVDSSADFRYSEQAAWEDVYGSPHGARCAGIAAGIYLRGPRASRYSHHASRWSSGLLRNSDLTGSRASHAVRADSGRNFCLWRHR